MDGFQPVEAATRVRFTLDQVLRMQKYGVLEDDGRYELIDGDLIEMSPQGVPHIMAKNRLARHFISTIGPEFEVIVDSTLKLSDASAPDPDIYIYPAQIALGELRPDQVELVVEVSDSRLDYDLTEKRDLYARHAVPEYWVLDVGARRMHVHAQPVQGRYADTRVVDGTERLRPARLPQCALTMADWPPFV
jgi:Uma2 family endonuclease